VFSVVIAQNFQSCPSRFLSRHVRSGTNDSGNISAAAR
jgi:hypothetical protein